MEGRQIKKFEIKYKLFKLEKYLLIFNWIHLLVHVLTELVQQLRRFVGLVLTRLLPSAANWKLLYATCLPYSAIRTFLYKKKRSSEKVTFH
jgi:hypothetical protein